MSLEAADRPNFFLHVTANGSLELAKWQAGDAFRHHASFSLHRGTWRAGLVALESLAEPGAFLYVSGPVLALRPYEHTEAFRRGTLFRLLGRCLLSRMAWDFLSGLEPLPASLATFPL